MRVNPDEKDTTFAGFPERAAAFMLANDVPVKRFMTDNAFAYRLSNDFQTVFSSLGAKYISIKLVCPNFN